MIDRRMTTVATATSGFQAKVIAARLGAEGMVWELRGAVDSIYPFGAVDVLVDVEDEERARELLMVDEVESAFHASADPGAVAADRSRLAYAAIGLAVAGFVALRITSFL